MTVLWVGLTVDQGLEGLLDIVTSHGRGLLVIQLELIHQLLDLPISNLPLDRIFPHQIELVGDHHDLDSLLRVVID